MEIFDKRKVADAYIAPTADVMGDVEIGKDSSVWYKAVIRSDLERIIIGERTNIQDLCVVHNDFGHSTIVGDDVTVGHGAIIHGCTIGNNSLIGMGSIILSGAKIGANCVVAAGALVVENMEVPDGSMVMGVPAHVVRKLTPEEITRIQFSAAHYVENAKRHFGTGSTL